MARYQDKPNSSLCEKSGLVYSRGLKYAATPLWPQLDRRMFVELQREVSDAVVQCVNFKNVFFFLFQNDEYVLFAT